ncbi:MAG: hypothetical protein WB566_16160 [Terriglobales bacterium]
MPTKLSRVASPLVGHQPDDLTRATVGKDTDVLTGTGVCANDEEATTKIRSAAVVTLVNVE